MEPPVILDGAHNPEAAAVLAATLREVAGKKPVALVVGFLSDKDPANFLRAFARTAKACWVVPIHNERGMPVDHVLAAARSVGFKPLAASLGEALESAKAWAVEHDGVVCVTGSLYLAGEVLAGR